MKIGDWVIHVDTGTLGRVRKLHAKGEYISPVNGKSVPDEVVEFDDGNTFLKAAEWAPLDSSDVAFLSKFNDAIKGVIMGAAANAATRKLPAIKAAASMRYVLERQARKLPVHAGDPGIPVG